MERYCGALQPAIRSRRYPYTSLDNYVVDRARLTHITLIYNLTDELHFGRVRPQGSHTSIPECKSYTCGCCCVLR